MSDPNVSREEAANEQRAAEGDVAQQDTGIIGTVERAIPFLREREDEPDTADEAEQLRRANDADQRD